jgi:hypothetical protein
MSVRYALCPRMSSELAIHMSFGTLKDLVQCLDTLRKIIPLRTKPTLPLDVYKSIGNFLNIRSTAATTTGAITWSHPVQAYSIFCLPGSARL